MSAVWFGIGVAASIATLVLFFREGAKPHSRRERFVRLGVHALLVFFVIFSVVQWQRNRTLNDIRDEAGRLSDRWNVENLEETSDSELYGIVTGGLAFLDKHSDELGDTHRDAQALYRTLLRDTPEESAPSDEVDPYSEPEDPRHDRLVEAAGAMVGIIESVEDADPWYD